MEDFQKRIKNFWPLKYDLTTRILMIIIPILLALTLIDYIRTKLDMESNFLNAKEQAKTSILQAIKMAESAYTLYSSTLDSEMKKGFSIFLKAYEESGRAPEKIDLTKLKKELGGNMDLYIIDENDVVIKTTYETDLGLDFEIYPEFKDYLKEVRKNGIFSSHRITPEIRTGNLRKFAYLPTPDGKYILELGLVSHEFSDIVNELNYLKIAKELAADYAILRGIRVFDMNGHLIGNPKETADIRTMVNIKKVVQNKKNMNVRGEEQGISYTYLYVRSTGETYQTESTRVVELTWNTLMIQRELRKKGISHFAVGALAIIGSILITFYTSHRISQPIHKIVKDVDIIAKGDLDHDIAVETKNELKILEQSINIMVHTIKDNMRKIKVYSENLQEMVNARTAELEYANEQLEIFVFSVTHDLRSPLNKLENYAETLLKKNAIQLGEEEKELTESILSEAKRIDKLILDLLQYSRMSRMEIELSSVDTRTIIYEAISQLELAINRKNAEVSIKGEIPDVMAHPATLQEVIANLISNGIKYVAPNIEPHIVISAEEHNEMARIIIEDNGIGIEEKYLEKIFMLFERLHSSDEYPGTGVGLAIVKRGIEKMGGRVGVESSIGKGSRFWIELPKAGEVEKG